MEDGGIASFTDTSWQVFLICGLLYTLSIQQPRRWVPSLYTHHKLASDSHQSCLPHITLESHHFLSFSSHCNRLALILLPTSIWPLSWIAHHNSWGPKPNATSLSRSCYSPPPPVIFIFRIRSAAGQRWWWGLWWWPWPCLRKPPKNSFRDTITDSSPTVHTPRGPVQLTINKEMMKFSWTRDKFQAGLVLVII